MAKKSPPALGRRERQIMDIVYQLGTATVAVVLDHLPDPPSYSAVRAMLNVLEKKGHLKHVRDKLRYVYMPTVPRDKARTRALHHLLTTFFDGSASQAVAALLDSSAQRMPDSELRELAHLIENARKKGR